MVNNSKLVHGRCTSLQDIDKGSLGNFELTSILVLTRIVQKFNQLKQMLFAISLGSPTYLHGIIIDFYRGTNSISCESLLGQCIATNIEANIGGTVC